MSCISLIEPFTRHAGAFTLWRVEPHPKYPDQVVKVPVHYDGVTHHSIRFKRPAPPLPADQARAWRDHHVAEGRAHDRPGEVGYLGVGFRPEGTGLVCVDVDDCVADGTWSPWALELINRFPGALLEQSVSGRGLHIWFTVPGEGPGRRGKRQTPRGALEVYGAGQYLACGTVLCGDAHVDHSAALEQLIAEFWPDQPPTAGPVLPVGEVTPEVLADVESALAHLDPDDRDEWVSAGQALLCLGDEGYRMWAAWSATSTRFPGGSELEKWDTFTGERSDYRAVLAKAQRQGWVNPAARQRITDLAVLFPRPVEGAPPVPDLPAGAMLEPPPGRELSFVAAAAGAIPSTLASVEGALASAESGVRIGYDTFLDRLSIGSNDGPWRAFTDTDYGRLRLAFERRGFKAVAAETMSTAVDVVAQNNAFDSAKDWVQSLQWDGVPRVDTLLHRFYSCPDTPYTRAVSAYMMTTLAGRAMVPGVKADMAVIMVGLQGAGKTSSVSALCPTPEAFGEVDLTKGDDDIARKMRGKMLIELAEMRGFKGRDADANKAWISREWEEWTPKYREFTTRYGRRCLIIGTANDMELLDDPTGARRFLPLVVGRVDVAGIAAERLQLWAEGAHRFRQTGIAWAEAERLAREQHGHFEVVDEMQGVVQAWLDSMPEPKIGEKPSMEPRSAHPFSAIDVLVGAMKMQMGQIKKSDQMAVAKVLRKLNYERKTLWIMGKAHKLWEKRGG